MIPNVIGRDRELAIAQEAIAKARKQRIPSRIAIIGEPGIGKTILLEGLASSADDEGWFVVETSCHEIQRNTSFITVNRLVSAAIRRLGADSHRYISGLEEGLAAFDISIAHLLGLPARGSALSQDRHRETCLRFFEGIGIDHPIFIACDDVQWIDPQSAEMLDVLASTLGQSALAIVSAERSNSSGNTSRIAGETLLRLFPLDFNSTKALIRSLLPEAEDAILDTVAHHTGGNPLQTAALCEDLRRNGLARSDRGLQDLVRDRVAEMDADEREFLQLCALLGEPMEYRVLFKLYPDSTRLGQLLGASVAPYLIADGPALRFRHALVLDAIRKTIGFELPLRRKIIAALESIESPDLIDNERLIEQAEALGDRDLVFATHIRSAEAAFVRKEWSVVAKSAERALAVRDPDSTQFVSLYVQYAVAMRSLERGAEASDITREALRKAEFMGLRNGIGVLVALLAAELWVMEDVDGALAVCEHFLGGHASEADRADVLAAALMVSALMFDEALFQKFDSSFEDVAFAARDQALAARGAARATMLSGQGRYEDAKRTIRRAVAEADRRESRQSDDLPFLELCIDIRQFGCGVDKERLPKLLRQTRFESNDLLYGTLLSAWMGIAQGDWFDARTALENARSIVSGFGLHASLLATAAMMSALSNGDVPLPEEATDVALRAIRNNYWESAIQLAPWLALRNPQPEFDEFLNAIATRHYRQPRMHIIGFTPAGLSLAGLARGNSALLAHVLSLEKLEDRSPWAAAQWKLARGIALEKKDSAAAAATLKEAAKDFARLDAPFFGAYSANRAGSATKEEEALLRGLGVAVRGTTTTPSRQKSSSEERFGLTPREWQVARLIADGNTNRQLADSLFLSERTVEVHVSNILSKLQLSSRTQLTRWMYERGPFRLAT